MWGFGSNAAGFSQPPSVFATVDDASEPFGRAGNTQQCFARNGETRTRSRWTPPEPPSRPLFQNSQSAFHSDATSSTTLFGTSQSGSSGGFGVSQATGTGGNFSFGRAGPTTTSSIRDCCNFVGRVDLNKATGLFGISTNSSVSSAQVFGFGGSTAKPPLAPSSNLFTASSSNTCTTKTTTTTTSFAAKPTTTFGKTSGFSFEEPKTKCGGFRNDPFAVVKVSANPFASTTVNPFSAKMAPNSTVNPFGSAVTANPFAKKAAANSTVNPFAAKVVLNATVSQFSPPTQSASSVDSFAVPSSTWSTGWSATASGGMTIRSASAKFKGRLRAPFKPTWSTNPEQLKQTQPLCNWGWKKSTEPTQPNAENLLKTLSASSSEAPSSSLVSATRTPSTPDVLVASPDTNPYGSGSFGAGLLEQKVKSVIANAPTSIELKVLDARALFVSTLSVPCLQPPSARFAARLGLARQPLQALPMRPVQPRFPSRKMPVAPSPVRAKHPQTDAFCFSSSFSRLAISKKSSRVRVKPSTMSVNTASSSIVREAERVDDEDEAQTSAVCDAKPDDAPSSHSSEDHDNKTSLSPACPGLLNEEYFTEPSIRDLQQFTDEELSSVENFAIGRPGYGKISFIGVTDVRGLELDNLVNFSDGEVVVYPDDNAKPEVGSGINKPADVDLHGISAEANEPHEGFLKRLETHTQALGAIFLGYNEGSQDGDGGVWSFRVEHF